MAGEATKDPGKPKPRSHWLQNITTGGPTRKHDKGVSMDCAARMNRRNSGYIADRGRLFARSSALAVATLLVSAPFSALAQSAPPASDETDASSSGGGDIVVTAQRREERIVDVPYNISAISGDSLTAAGAVNATDLTKVVAGLTYVSDGPADKVGNNNFSMRGLRTDAATSGIGVKISVSPVSIYYGDTPVFYPLMTKDLERVEVLRGPQGTLYGSGAQAGAIRFIPKRPSFDAISGEVNASTGITQKAGGLNYSADGVINLPIAENLAIRISGAYVRQAGYIDQVNLLELDANGTPVPSIPGDLSSGPVVAPIKEDTNSWTQWMMRGAARYQPTDWLDIEAAYLHQEIDAKDTPVPNPAYQGGLRDISSGFYPNAPYQTRPGGKYASTLPTLQPVKATLDLVTGTVAFDLGFAQLSSISSYYKNKLDSDADLGNTYINPAFNFATGYNHYPRFAATSDTRAQEKGFTQEVRLVSQGDSAFSYVLGLFYYRQKKDADYDFVLPGIYAFSNSPDCGVGCNPGANPQLSDLIYSANQDFLSKEKAAFGELTYHITPAWQVTGGIRVFKNTQTFDTYQRYPFFGAPYGDGVTEPISEGASFRGGFVSSSKEVFKLNTSYDLDPDNMVYFTFAQGYRRGGANPLATTGPTASLPEYQGFQPDIADNYELGIKGITAGRKLSYSVSAFWINLKDFQFSGSTPSGYGAVFNGEKAVSKGLEAEFSFRATRGLTLSGSYAFVDTNVPKATIIRDLAATSLLDGFQDSDIINNPGATVAKGAVLPGVSKHSATAAIDYEIPLAGDSKLVLHANANYRSKQNNVISTTAPEFAVIPSVFMADARITYESGQGWSGSLFVSNLTNSYGSSGTQGVQTTNVGEPQALLYAGRYRATPRTFGVSLHYGF